MTDTNKPTDSDPLVCAHSLKRPFLAERLADPGDIEGERVAPNWGDVVDAHVHFFPDRVFDAIWRWFDKHAWPVRYRLYAQDVLDALLSRGVKQMVGLTYAHKAGMAESLNVFMATLAENNPQLLALGTVYPGEANATDIVDRAFARGLRGIKLHSHVQGMTADDERLFPIYERCEAEQKALVIHAGREPKSDAYPKDPYEICDAARIERVLRRFPKLKLCVPHLGADEFEEYASLLERFPEFMLDSTMVLADYFQCDDPFWMLKRFPKQIMYGSDFPNLPYAWDRELKCIAQANLEPAHRRLLLSENALRFYGQ